MDDFTGIFLLTLYYTFPGLVQLYFLFDKRFCFSGNATRGLHECLLLPGCQGNNNWFFAVIYRKNKLCHFYSGKPFNSERRFRSIAHCEMKQAFTVHRATVAEGAFLFTAFKHDHHGGLIIKTFIIAFDCKKEIEFFFIGINRE